MAYYNVIIKGKKNSSGERFRKYRSISEKGMKILPIKDGDLYVNVYKRLDPKGLQTVYLGRMYVSDYKKGGIWYELVK